MNALEQTSGPDAQAQMFFAGRPDAFLLYERLMGELASHVGAFRIKVQKTQISFYQKRLFGCVSFLPLGRATQRPKDYLTVTFGLGYRLSSPRIGAAVEPCPGRWTHHVMVSALEEIDEELMTWLWEASVFSAAKR